VVLASFNMDLVMRAERQPAPGETLQGEFATYLGGKGFNQAIATRRLGAGVSVIGRVGNDEYGRLFLDALDREGIDRSSVSIDGEVGTGVAQIIVDERGENAIVQAPRANRRIARADVDATSAAFEGSGAALFQLETSDEAALAFAQAARARGVRTILNPAPARRVSATLLALADVIVANALEAATLSNEHVADRDDAVRAAKSLRERLRASIVVTLGQDGAVFDDRHASGHIRAHDIDAVDAVGAGDAFCAALAVATSEGADLEHAVRFATAAGALATTKRGAEPSMPYRHEVEALLAKGVTT
jgi:ribokinase